MKFKLTQPNCVDRLENDGNSQQQQQEQVFIDTKVTLTSSFSALYVLRGTPEKHQSKTT